MSWAKSLKFSHKIFIAIFATALVTILIVCGAFYEMTASYRREDFKSSYEDHMQLLGTALMRVEETQSQLAQSTALAVQEALKKGPLSTQELKRLAIRHGVAEISIFNNQGQEIASSEEVSENIFSHCDEVRGLLTGAFNISETPMLLNNDGTISRHTMVATLDHRQIVGVSVEFKAVTQLLGEMAQHDEDNEYVELIGPTNTSLGQLHRRDLPDDSHLKDNFNRPDGGYWIHDKLLVISSLPAKMQNYCGARNGQAIEPRYRLITSISTKTFTREKQRLLTALLVIGVLLMVLALILARYLTRLLLRKIESIRTVVHDITKDQNYSRRIDVADSADEIDDLARGFNGMFEAMQAHQNQMLEAERDKARSQIAAQVAHDIRSPLMSMGMAVNQIQTTQVDALAILRSAIQRVAAIAQKLSASANISKPSESSNVEVPKLTLLEPLIVSVLNEHRIKDRDLALEGLSLFPHIWTVVQVGEFQTALSNILNNAFEAGATKVRLELRTETKKCILKISDNGKGMSSEIQGKIFERSFTFGKATGTGLGLFQAKSAVEWSGGSIEVHSIEWQGTEFVIQLPMEKTPSWIAQTIEVPVNGVMFFVDDDENILQAWKERPAPESVRKFFLTSIADLEKAQDLQHWPENAVLVIDQNLAETTKGLDVLASLAIGKRSYLCTTDFDEKKIQDQVKKLGVWLVPKPCIAAIEIKVREQ
ncbi:MAG TPA: HAMP domain-containing sensor histidine kinase [Bdellovibrio sp.]|uniref:sensor histidine kinase n=1 Tax=Bdellovibrio sp. TaxID=28201 RepID=UPI002EFAA787